LVANQAPEAYCIRVLIADDHRLLRAGLRSLLAAEPDMQVVGEAADGTDALQLALELRPDVLLADISMPGPDGIELARWISRELPTTRVLMVSMHEDVRLVQDALAAGAAGYVSKRAAEADLVTAIRTVASGEVYLHPTLHTDALKSMLAQRTRAGRVQPWAAGLLNHDTRQSALDDQPVPSNPPSSGDAAPSGQAVQLSEREAEMLRLLAGGATTARLAQALALSTAQVDQLRHDVMARLDLHSRVDIVRFALQHGLIA
jgi:DNA-binding NarL/FixJ family response regulator